MSRSHSILQKGFTLIELIIVIVLLGVLSIGTFAYLGLGAQIFFDVAGREQLSAQSRFAIERLSRELRNSLPGSARTFVPANSSDVGGRCIEFLPIRGAGIYLHPPQVDQPLPVSIAQNLTSLPNSSTLPPVLSPTDYEGLYFFIAANNETRIYGPESSSRAKIGLGAVKDLGTHYEIDLKNDIGLNRQSPARRYFLTSSPVAWCVEGGQPPYSLVRYSDYSDFTQVFPPSIDTLGPFSSAIRTTMAEQLHEGNGASPFTTQVASLSRNNLILINLFFARREGQEPLTIHHEVHVPNVP